MNYRAPLLVALMWLGAAWPAFGLSMPMRVDAVVTVHFARGAVALDAADRNRIASELARVLWHKPCDVRFGVDGYADEGMASRDMDALALERAKYLRGLVDRLNLGTPSPILHVGGRAPSEAIHRGTGVVVLVGNVGEHACPRS